MNPTENILQKLQELKNDLLIDKLDLATLIKKLKANGVNLPYRDIQSISSKIPRYGEFVFPCLISKFIIQVLKGQKYKNIVDTWARYGELLNPVIEEISFSKAIGIVHNSEQLEVANMMTKVANVEWKQEQPSQLIQEIPDGVDVIISAPPFLGGTKIKTVLSYNNETIEYQDQFSNLLLLKSMQLLSSRGIGIFIVPQSFFLETNKPLLDMMNRLDLYIHAAVTLPSDTFDPYSKMLASIVIVKRKKTNELFVAKINDETDISRIVNNMRHKRGGRNMSFGMLVNHENFTSFQALAKQREVEIMVKKMNLTAIPLRELAIEINRSNEKLEEGFEEKPNSVYLPLIGGADVVTSLAQLKLKPQNYAQLVFNEDKVIAEFMAYLLNTEFGMCWRESLFTGGTIPKISKKTLMQSILYLPDLNTQLQTVSIQADILNVRSDLNRLERQLWKNPLKYKDVQKELQQINRSNGFEEWIEGLPFPLASILWRYIVETDIRFKKDILLHFFEAFAQFHVMIMLSALMSNKSFFEERKNNWVNEADLTHLHRSSFGTWIEIAFRLAKTIRQELSSNDSLVEERLLRMFHQKSFEYIRVITNKKVLGILQLAKEIRNQDAHGGIKSLEEAKRKLAVLESELYKLREVIGGCYEDICLIRPEQNQKSLEMVEDDLYRQSIDVLMGTRSPFRKEEIEIRRPLLKTKLYLYNLGQMEALELVPLVKFMPSPAYEENACYFYNSVDKDGIRWKSYHFDKEAEVVVADDSLFSVLDRFVN